MAMGSASTKGFRDRVVTVKIRWFSALVLFFHPLAHLGGFRVLVRFRSASLQMNSAARCAVVRPPELTSAAISVWGESRSSDVLARTGWLLR